MPVFSVILATRDRPGLFAEALRSVLAQGVRDLEILVVDDGSTEENRRACEPVLEEAGAALGDRLRVLRLPRRPRGHGQAYALNTGAAAAAGTYLCFLDDDDAWTDPGHLARAAAALGAEPGTDLYMANQVAYRGEVAEPGPAWIGGLADLARSRGIAPRADGSFRVGVAELMALTGFCHVNALIVRRAFYEDAGGMDEGIRWECDRDLFLRLVDRAGTILHHPAVVARHNIPDPAKAASMTTSLGMLDRWLYQLRVLDKASLLAGHPAIRAHARLHKGWTLKRIAETLAAEGRWDAAAAYARQALGAAPTLKWLGYALYCQARAAAGGAPRR